MGTDADVVILGCNTRQLLRACLASVFASQDVTPRVFVADNVSSDRSAPMAAAGCPQVLLRAAREQFPGDPVGNRAKLDGVRRWWRTRARRMSPPVVSRSTPLRAA